MNDSTKPDSPSGRPAILRPDPRDDRYTSALHAGVHRRELARIRTGAYVKAPELRALSRRQRHVLLVHAAMARLDPRYVVSHGSAAALHHLPSLGPPPDRVHVTDAARERSQTWRGVIKHAARLTDDEIVTVDGIRVTSIARTAADIALSHSRADAVVVLDHILHTGRAEHAEIAERLAAVPTARARVSARAALDFASASAESPGESFARVLADQLGAPEPVLQYDFGGEHGYVVDFWFAEQGVVLEFDGFVKYSDPRLLRGRTPAQVAMSEKVREDRIRALREVKGFGRCVWSDLERLRRFASILTSAGVPLTRPP